MDDTPPRRFQLSLRSLMIACAVFALACVPLAWVARERQQMLRLQDQILMAREVALASAIREEKARRDQAVAAASSVAIEDLRRENEALRARVETLSRELGTLRQRARVAGPAGQ